MGHGYSAQPPKINAPLQRYHNGTVIIGAVKNGAFVTTQPYQPSLTAPAPSPLPLRSPLPLPSQELLGFGPKPKEKWEMSAEEKVSEAESLKTQGNAAFKAGDMDEAVAQYTDAVSYLEHLGGKGGGEEEKGSSDAVDVLKLSLFNNSAAALIKAGDFAEAAASASKALAVDADNVKALWRRGEARMQFGMLGEAKKDLVAAAKLDPKNKTIRKTYAALKKKVAVNSMAWKTHVDTGLPHRALYTESGSPQSSSLRSRSSPPS